VILAAGAAATAEQIALCSLQVRAVRADPRFSGGDYYATGARPVVGMSIARGLGQVSYRTAEELEERFHRDHQSGIQLWRNGQYSVESYLEYQGEKLSARFDPNSYIVLSEAMNRHDLGRERGDAASALSKVQAEVTVAGVTTDRLYPLALQRELAALLPGQPEVELIDSHVGHDGFLVEIDQVAKVISRALASH
jgi:homoserine O-acetyltransferase